MQPPSAEILFSLFSLFPRTLFSMEKAAKAHPSILTFASSAG
jgi:hypothetical protein